jgi:hypothetical protein
MARRARSTGSGVRLTMYWALASSRGRLDLERDLGRIFGREADEPVADGAGRHADLGQDRGEEAAAREGASLEVGQVAAHEQAQVPDAGFGGQRGLDDVSRENRVGPAPGYLIDHEWEITSRTAVSPAPPSSSASLLVQWMSPSTR